MKRFFLILCCMAMLLTCGCAGKQDKTSVQKILIIGNSHSVDAFHLLYQAYADLFPDVDLTLGVLYYSGCSITKHVDFAQNDEPVYRYYKNTRGNWKIKKKVDMKTVLEDQEWTTILLQAAKTDLDDTLNEPGRRALEAYVDQHVSTPHDFVWHTSWPSPNDENFFNENAEVTPPEGYKENLENLYGFDPVNQYTVLTEKAKAHILTDKTYPLAVCTGTAIMYAHLTEGCPQQDLWRDYTHLKDYGRLVAAYSMAVQLNGQPAEAIGIDSIPAKLRHSRFEKEGDLILTDEMKQVLLRAANYSLECPFSMPEKT